MTNALQVNQSTVVGGLGTQSFTVVTTGMYTLSFKSFIPYLAAGSPAVTANPVAEIQTVTVTGDTAGSLNSTYWTFYSAGDLQGFYVWYNINSAGVDPAPAGLTGIQVAAATGANSSAIGSATRTAIAASSAASQYVTVTGSTSAVTLNNIQVGSCTAAADGTAATGFAFAVGTTGTYGTPAISGLDVVLKQNSTVLARYGFPTPTQPIMGGSVVISASASDVITIVLSSLSAADNALNAVKTIVNLFQGIGA
jgi:hypothetical protein